MSNKFVLTSFVLVSVTILSGCGGNKSNKAKFRPKGGAIAMKGTAAGSCDIMSPGGASGTAEQCKAAEEIVKANAKPECKASWKSEMTRRGCAIDATLFADAPEVTPTKRNDDLPPGTLQTVGEVKGTDGKATAEEVVSTSATDTASGDIDVRAQTGGAAAAGINTDGLADVPAPGTGATVPGAATSTVPGAAATTPDASAGTVAPSVAALVSPEEMTRFRADSTSCPSLKKINQKAKAFASSLDIASEDPLTPLSSWARRVCINNTVRTEAAVERARLSLWTSIKAGISTSSTWTAEDQVSKCSTELATLAKACSNSVRYGGKTTDIWGTRLTAESTPAEIAAAAGETPPTPGAADAAGAGAPADAQDE